MGCQQSLAYKGEVRPSSSSLSQGGARYPIIGSGLQKANSCTQEIRENIDTSQLRNEENVMYLQWSVSMWLKKK